MDSKRYISLEYISMAEALHCPYTLLTDAKLTSLRAYNEWLSKFELQLEGYPHLHMSMFTPQETEGWPLSFAASKLAIKQGPRNGYRGIRERAFTTGMGLRKGHLFDEGEYEGCPNSARYFANARDESDAILGAIISNCCSIQLRTALRNRSLHNKGKQALTHLRSLATPADSHTTILAAQQRVKTLRQQPNEDFTSFQIKHTDLLNKYIKLTELSEIQYDDPSILSLCMCDNLYDAGSVMEAKRGMQPGLDLRTSKQSNASCAI